MSDIELQVFFFDDDFIYLDFPHLVEAYTLKLTFIKMVANFIQKTLSNGQLKLRRMKVHCFMRGSYHKELDWSIEMSSSFMLHFFLHPCYINYEALQLFKQKNNCAYFQMKRKNHNDFMKPEIGCVRARRTKTTLHIILITFWLKNGGAKTQTVFLKSWRRFHALFIWKA